MWNNVFAAAIHNLLRNRAYAALNVLGLAIGFAAALLIVLFVRDELSYDRMWPAAERTYRLSMDIKGPRTTALGNADGRFGPAIELDFPEVENATRLQAGSGYLKYRDVTVWADFRYADPDFFAMFPPTIIAGDPDDALHKQDMLVITRRFAQRLFGRLDVVGLPVELRLIDTRTLLVGAVIEDLPSNTHFTYEVIASNVGSTNTNNALTYVRLRPGADVGKLRADLPAFVRRHIPDMIGGQPAWRMLELHLTMLPDIHFMRPSITDMKPPSDRRTVSAFVGVGLLTLAVAACNFVSMMTARAARRAVEVGVRKALGATRRQIVAQFLAECLLYAGLALGLAVIAVELLLPAFNGFLDRRIAFDIASDPTLFGGIVAAWLIVAAAASAYPALVLSQFRPVTVLKGVLSLPGGPGRLRSVMVTAQFAVLVALVICTLTIHRQTRFAIEDQLRTPRDETFIMRAPCALMGFQNVARQIPGVLSAACGSDEALGQNLGAAHFTRPDGTATNLNGSAVDERFFATMGIEPVAGRLFDAQHGEDTLLAKAPLSVNPSIILNESAARVLGYSQPADAIGKSIYWTRSGVMPGGRYGRTEPQPSQIVGVVPDFSAGSIRNLIEPSVYYVDPQSSFVLILKLDGLRLPETLRALQDAWRRAAGGRPMVGGQFLGQMLESLYADIQRQSRLFAAFSGVAVIVASLGLLGLAVFNAERRTREIGVRKALGASRGDILRLVGWQFARPVLAANLIAWPVAGLLMQRWLEGFAYRVALGAYVFVLASALALAIALVTVAGHALLVSRAPPVAALRYE